MAKRQGNDHDSIGYRPSGYGIMFPSDRRLWQRLQLRHRERRQRTPDPILSRLPVDRNRIPTVYLALWLPVPDPDR